MKGESKEELDLPKKKVKDSEKVKEEIIIAGYIAIDQFLKIAKENFIIGDDGLSVDKLKNVVTVKKMAVLDAFELLEKISGDTALEIGEKSLTSSPILNTHGFAERNAKK